MKMKKQTAVDWLISQLNKPGFAEVVTEEEIQQAKEMERAQIEEAFFEGLSTPEPVMIPKKTPEDYYDETFNTKEK